MMDTALAEQIEQGGAMRLWLSQPQWLNLLKQVEDARRQRQNASPYTGIERRQSDDPRKPLHALCALRIQDAGRSLTYQAPCHDISAGGIGLILPEAVNKGSRCTLAIRHEDDNGLVTSGRVAWCRPCADQLYELGIQFDMPIDPQAIFGREQRGA